MKKLMGLLILLTLFIFTSCSNQEKDRIVNIDETRVSPNTSLNFETNFDYENYDILINESPVNVQSSPGSFFINNADYGQNNLTMKFFDESENLITNYSTSIFFDNQAPQITNQNIFIEKSVLNINFEVESDDYLYSVLRVNDTLISSTTNTSFYKNIRKNSGEKNITIKLFDETYNTTTFSTSIHTNIDNKPKILSNVLSINLFSEYNLDFSDDWDKELNIFITDNGINSFFYPYKILETELSTATINAFDSSNNFDFKTVKILRDKNIPKSPIINSRLISSESGFFSWVPEGDNSKYVIEIFDDDYGWYSKYDTDSSFFEIREENLSFIRKISSNRTKGFPSPPIIKFKDNLKPYASGILENINENSILNQINSPFIVASDILIDEGNSLFIESGTILRFFADSRLIVRGNLFIMPGLVESEIIGNGMIVMDGGNLIVSDTKIENIDINGDEGKLIFLEDINFLNDSNLNVQNIFRVQLYNIQKNLGVNNFKNISGLYIKNSSLNNSTILNSNEALLYNSTINDFSQSFRTRSVIENCKIASIQNTDFSYLYSIDTEVDEVYNDNFSLFLDNLNNFSGD
ncbi:MAG: hypothetical protein ACQESN_00695 [Thermotogota bacterium]